MPIAGMCPYFQREQKQKFTYCELVRLKFPDPEARREILYGYCAHPENFRNCMFKQVMDAYYDRKYAEEEGGCRK